MKQLKQLKRLLCNFAEEEDAVGVVEIILILVVLIGLVIIFKEQLTNLVRSIPLRLRSAEWKTWATTNRMTALSARMADIWTMFQNILLTPKMVQSEKSLFTVVKTARIVLTVLSAARQKMRTGEKKSPSAGNFRRCVRSLTRILPPKKESCFAAIVPFRQRELSVSSSTTAASNGS